MTTNRPEFKAHDDFIFEHKEIGKVTREEFIKYIRSSHEHMRKLSQIIQQYNQTIDSYLEEWDGQFESFDDDVKDLLGRWINDGTMDHIINENLMSIKADKSYVDDLNENVNAQLAQTTQQTEAHINSINKHRNTIIEKRLSSPSGYNVGDIVIVYDNILDWTPEKWEIGSISSGTGLDMESTIRLRFKEYIDVLPNTNYIVSVLPENETYGTIIILQYDINDNVINTTGWVEDGFVVEMTASTAKIRVIVRNMEGTIESDNLYPSYPNDIMKPVLTEVIV